MKILYVPVLNLGVYYWRIENYSNQIYKLYGNDKHKVMVDNFFDPREGIAWDKVCIGAGEYSDIIQSRLNEAFKYFDVIVFQRIQNKNGMILVQELKEKYPNVKIVAEIDDSVGDITPSNPYIDKLKLENAMAAHHLKMSDAVIVSTDYLKKSIIPIVGSKKKIHVAPNCIDYDTWKWHITKTKPKGIRIGYCAGGGHDEDLKIAYKAMLPIMKENTEVKFIVRYNGYRPEWLTHKQVDFKQVIWHISKFPQHLYNMKLDLALAPLRDTNFNRCKSNLKFLEWASLGVPLVASNVEPYKKTKGTILLTSNNIPEFTQKIREGLKYNTSISNLLKKQCRENYNLKKETEKLLTFFKSMLK